MKQVDMFDFILQLNNPMLLYEKLRNLLHFFALPIALSSTTKLQHEGLNRLCFCCVNQYSNISNQNLFFYLFNIDQT